MSQADGKKEALKLALDALRNTDLAARAELLSLGSLENENLYFRSFGKEYLIRQNDYEIIYLNGQQPKDDEKILILHYLLCEVPLIKPGKFITFREFPGGQFYWNPFIARTVNPLVEKFGNDLDALKKKLDKYDWKEFGAGDFSSHIHAIGNISIVLVYHAGDEEFQPVIDVLFDEYSKWVYSTDDAVYVASKICLGLL